MATSGNYGTTNQYIVYWIEYYANSQNITNNTTNITAKVWAKRTNSGYSTYGSGTVNLSINGTNYSASITNSQTITSTPRCLIEKTVDIPHNTDGKKVVRLEASISHSQFSSGTNGLNWTLSTIPRASSVTCTDGNIGSAVSININRASTSFTHTLTYKFYDMQGTIVTKTSNTNIGWTIPTTFYTAVPDTKSSWGTIYCNTYQGNTLIGTKECRFNVYVTNSNPTISGTVTDVNQKTVDLTGDANKLVKYYSNAKVVMTATAKNSATIKSQKVVCGNKSGTSATSTLNGIESGTFNLSCTDSRGNTGSATVTKTLINYIKLAFTQLTVSRPTTTSNTINVSIKGNYFNASFGSVANTLTLRYRWRIKNGSWSSYTTLTATKSGNTFSYSGALGTNFDFNNEYEFEFQIIDKLATVTNTKTVTRGEPIIDIGKNDVRVNGKIYKSENNQTSEILGQTILYNNTTGTSGTVTLSESAANFDYIEIFYSKWSDSHPEYDIEASYTKVSNPNGKNVNLVMNHYTADNNVIQIFGDEVNINGTTITRVGHMMIGILTNSSQGVVQWENTKQGIMHIQKVVGYR